jgi:ribosomal protein L3 glutamine methyltransferase
MRGQVNQSISVEQWILQAAEQFEQADLFYGHGTERAIDEAAYLVLGALDLPFSDQRVLQQQVDSARDQQRLKDLIYERIHSRKPVAYLIHKAWFAGMEFYVDERVLIPRSPFAELIQNRFHPWLQGENIHTAMEIGTGSGCIAIAMAEYLPQCQMTAADNSADALAVARKNIELHQLQNRVELVDSDLFQGVQGRRFDLIVSNPPYVPEQEWRELPEEYHHEPRYGLVSGETGLDAVNEILAQAKDYLTDQGVLIVEVGFTQDALEQACPEMEFTWIEFEHGGQGVFLLTRDQLSSM